MVSAIRSAFNADFTDKKYQDFLDHIHALYSHEPPFRIAETPIFIDKSFTEKIFEACQDISDTICRPDYKALTEGALTDEYRVPNEDDHTLFLQMDFGVCEGENGELEPKLIEIQGFPSLYFYQHIAANAYRKFFNISDNYTHLFNGLTKEGYLDLLRNAIVKDHNPKNVVLLEIEPDNQVTRIDFLGASRHLGIKTLCISDLKVEGRDVYYLDDSGKKVGVERIFNRVIFDELVGRKDLPREFMFTDEYNIDWAGHPNWFFRISKYTMPLLNSKYVPKCYFLDKLDKIPDDLENYVLKPLYSFSGSGVIFNVTQAHIDNIKNPENYILQEKVTYSPVIQTLDVPSKCELRMLMLWDEHDEKPRIVNNLARLSKGDMVGVRYNKDRTWVGGSVGFFEK